MDTGINHETEDRLRNLEAHAGIGHTDPETGEYTVEQSDQGTPVREQDEAVVEPGDYESDS